MEEKEVLVKVENVSKKFCLNLNTSLRYGLQDIVKGSLGLKIDTGKLRPKEFWAVKNISFELRRGECIGLIGHNGAGKSTLLKMLNGLYAPDEGKITMKGKVGALIELGAGFNPILTGRENIYNNAAVLGFSREEVDARMQSIIDFSEIEQFLDTPVKNYSSGMRVRLGFAVAAHMNPDVLIIDEVLAVGDIGFVLKCFKKIDEILPNTAVIFVSHNMPQISRICNEILLMDHGKVDYHGYDVGKGIELYYKKFSSNDQNIVYDDGSIELISVKTKNNSGEAVDSFKWLEDITFELKFRNKKLSQVPHFNLAIVDKEQRGIAILDTTTNRNFLNENDEFTLVTTYKRNNFSKGKYGINLASSQEEGFLPVLRINNILEFFIEHPREIWQPMFLESESKIV